MNLEKLDEKLFNDYKRLCQERGIAVKTRNPAKRSLPFKDTVCGSNTSNPRTPEAPALQENIMESGSSSSNRLVTQSPFQSGISLLNSPLPSPVSSPDYEFKSRRTKLTPNLPLFSKASSSCSLTPRPVAVPAASASSVTSSVSGHSKSKVIEPKVAEPAVVTKNVATQTVLKSIPAKRKRDAATPVFVRAEWDSGPREKELPEYLSFSSKMLVRGTLKQIASAAWRCSELRPFIMKEFFKTIHKECANLCSKKEPSMLRKTSKSDILEFKFETLGEELSQRVPLLYGVLRTASLKKLSDDMHWLPSACMAAAICLKNRSVEMTSVQLLVPIILKHSGLTVSKTVILGRVEAKWVIIVF